MPQIVLSSGSSMVIPLDCHKFDSIECTGAGAPGGAGANGAFGGAGAGGSGGGSGAYALKSNVFVTPGSTAPYTIGTNSNATSFNTNTCVAAGGSGISGGPAGACIGDVITAGLNGAGGSGGSGTTGGTGGHGATGGGPYGGVGGVGGVGAGAFVAPVAGTAGNAWGSGGGGGGGGSSNSAHQIGAGGGAPFQGVIVLTYTPSHTTGGNMPMLGM